MSYDYVHSTYGVTPIVGQRVRHTVTGKSGTITREREPRNYVHVRFDGLNHDRPCHPTELEYGP